MSTNPYPPPLTLKRQRLTEFDQAERIHALALKILAFTGLEVRQPEIQAKLAAAGLKIRGERVYFEPEMVNEFVEVFRQKNLEPRRERVPEDDGKIRLAVSSYSLFVHDMDSGKVVPYTAQRLEQMTRLVDTLAGEGVVGTPPGIPVDVHPHLQPVAQYRIAALNARQGATPVDPTSALTARFLFEMAEVMNSPWDSLPVYMPTPLRLGGESLDVALACLDKVEFIGVSSMPATGTTAPIHPFGALALAAAEVIGGAICVKILTQKEVGFYVNIFPSDLREGSMVFGSPENMLFQMLSDDMNRFYGQTPGEGPNNIHVMAKLPDCQSAAEKASIMTLGAFLGTRWFSCAGTLSLDEIFSPEQLLVDCEIRDWVQRAIQGVWMGEEAVDDWVAEIRVGVQRGFMRLDSTLDHYKTQTWYSRRFLRGAIGPWDGQGQPQLSDKLRDEVRRRLQRWDFELDAARRVEIERIYAAAEKAVLG
jgi:trimethylamine--corrinoid protein Co-methyltransferase